MKRKKVEEQALEKLDMEQMKQLAEIILELLEVIPVKCHECGSMTYDKWRAIFRPDIDGFKALFCCESCGTTFTYVDILGRIVKESQVNEILERKYGLK